MHALYGVNFKYQCLYLLYAYAPTASKPSLLNARLLPNAPSNPKSAKMVSCSDHTPATREYVTTAPCCEAVIA